MASDLASRRCVPCEGGASALGPDDVARLRVEVPDWAVEDDCRKLHRHLKFKDFVTLMAFVGRLAQVAEAEGHHPDFCVHYADLDVTLWTHAVGGLSENDFVLAAKLDRLPR